MSRFSHVDGEGKPRMVDVSKKEVTEREAVAEGCVFLPVEVLDSVERGELPKGDLATTARLAGISAAKRTWDLIPLCHQIPLSLVEVDLHLDRDLPGVVVQARVKGEAKTGVEMEALTAVSVACLTVYDMVKAVCREATIGRICLLEKRGGKSGEYVRKA
ncbi:MAG: cyclic pyranopterin monophosphate synthase MoaC [Deltaproteobacteria bacterium]|nr:MAG: cyclic pyranopterin monophosphate synthase MoaC [Deltaproteobacteria bacterium]